MLDIKIIRKTPQIVKKNLKNRGENEKIKWIDDLLKKDKEVLSLKQKIENLRHERNVISSSINKLKKENKNASKEIKKAKELPSKIKQLEDKFSKLNSDISKYLNDIPNLLHSSVKIGKDETQNKVTKKWGVIPKFNFPIKNHVELLEKLNVVDFDSSAKVSGNGFYYLKGELALLNQALIRFVIDFMAKKNYSYIEPPLMINRKVAAAAGDLSAFEDALYKIESENLYLIPTSEHAILGLLYNKVINEKDLPLKFFGYSMCFRKEIGSHGINEKGLWRTHQFNKIEQFIFCKPQDSWKYYEELKKNSEQLYQKLKLPYRVLEMCSGDISAWKAKTEDIEVYRPTTKQYEEVGSLSNCTDYQARDLNMKGVDNKRNKYVLHTLNNTAIATSRTMVAIVENYQQKDGSIKVPLVLRKYTGFNKIASK
ncbi:serine--tRNA ligase [archaeon]|nr:serine--tRNA ligase [archaeon]